MSRLYNVSRIQSRTATHLKSKKNNIFIIQNEKWQTQDKLAYFLSYLSTTKAIDRWKQVLVRDRKNLEHWVNQWHVDERKNQFTQLKMMLWRGDVACWWKKNQFIPLNIFLYLKTLSFVRYLCHKNSGVLKVFMGKR